MGRRRVRNLRHIGGHEVAGVEPNDERRSSVAAELEVEAFATLDEGVGWGPDAVVISTPPDQHSGPGLAVARAGIPFFTEASVVTDGMAQLIDVARSAGV